jgi:hypothetical protein
MPVVIPTNKTPLTVEDIRMFLRDLPSKNPLLLGELEFSDADLTRAMSFAVDKYNAMTPQTNLTDPSYVNRWVLMVCTCSILLRSEGLRQLRNQLITQDGNIAPVGLDEKQALYLQWADNLQAEFDGLVRQIKTQNNMEACYGGLSSGYRYIGRWTA